VIPPAATTPVADRQDRPQPGPLGVRWIAPSHAHSTIRAGRASRGPYDTCVLIGITEEPGTGEEGMGRPVVQGHGNPEPLDRRDSAGQDSAAVQRLQERPEFRALRPCLRSG
jgi:hypothetical protein